MADGDEWLACTPHPLDPAKFNREADLPYGCEVAHIQQALSSFLDFLGFVNGQLYSRDMPRLESLLMTANFSSIVGEFVAMNLPKYCPTLRRNQYHNGRPDLIPTGHYANDAVQHGQEGIEVKASRYQRGWQGHNPESGWLLVVCFDSNSTSGQNRPPTPFQFTLVACARLEAQDWRFSGRSATSRRTITAAVAHTGYQKLLANWIYRI